MESLIKSTYIISILLLLSSCELFNNDSEQKPFRDAYIFHFVNSDGIDIFKQESSSFLTDSIAVYNSTNYYDHIREIYNPSFYCTVTNDSLVYFQIYVGQLTSSGKLLSDYPRTFPRDTIYVKLNNEELTPMYLGYEKGTRFGEEYYYQIIGFKDSLYYQIELDDDEFFKGCGFAIQW